MVRRKYRFKSREEAENAETKANIKRQIAYQCMRCLVRDEVAAKIKKHPYTAMIVYPESPSGGYLILVYHAKDSVGKDVECYLIEDWLEQQRQSHRVLGFMHDRKLMELHNALNIKLREIRNEYKDKRP